MHYQVSYGWVGAQGGLPYQFRMGSEITEQVPNIN